MIFKSFHITINIKTKRNRNVAICKLDFEWEYEIFSILLFAPKPSGVSGVMVSIVAFQAVDRGSIPCWRIFVAACNCHQIMDEKIFIGVSGVMASIVAFQAVDRGSIPRWRSFFDYFHYKNNKNKSCQKWDSNPRPHSWTRMLSPTVGGRSYPWVWRLRPLGHPDMSEYHLKDMINQRYFLRTKKCSRWGLNSQPPHILHQ